jgi:hypothetical protein
MRRIAIAALGIASFALPSTIAQAAADDAGTTDAEVDSGGTVTSEAGTGDLVSGVVYTSGGSSGPKCSWDRYSNYEFERATGTPPREPPQYHDDPDVEVAQEELDRREAELVTWQRNEDRRRAEPKVTYFGGEAHYVYAVRCIGFTGTVRLVPTTVATDDLIPGLHDVATDRILVPVPDVSPELGFTGYVNLGMWLAVEPAAIAPITAEAGPDVWITVRTPVDPLRLRQRRHENLRRIRRTNQLPRDLRRRPLRLHVPALVTRQPAISGPGQHHLEPAVHIIKRQRHTPALHSRRSVPPQRRRTPDRRSKQLAAAR